MITVSLTILLQNNKKSQKLNQLALINKKQAAFHYLLTVFQSAPLLKYYDLNLPIKVKTNISKFIIVNIFS